MKQMIRLIWGILLVLIIVACDALPKEEEKLVPPLVVPEEASYKTKVIERGDIEDALTVKGEIIPLKIEYLYVRLANSRIETIDTLLGAEVKRGDILLHLVTEDLEESMSYLKVEMETKSYDIEIAKELFELEKTMDESTYLTLETPYSQNNFKSQMALKDLSFQNSLKAKENSLKVDQLKLKDMEKSLEAAKIKSTIDGSVVYIKKMEEGDIIEAYDKLIGIADVTDIQIAYEGTDASDFNVGNEVLVSYKGKEYGATVTMTPGTVPEEEKELYPDTVFFAFNEPVTDLVRGNIVDVKLVHESSLDTLLIPKSLVLKAGEDKLVYVLEDGLKVERYVTTGVESGIYIEITDGLRDGDEVIYN
jgi:multidrug efflux pump subunit AcrA (membrane-fusion protein)